jgi:hypothetical protein
VSIPPTAVGGSFTRSLQTRPEYSFRNTPNGSWGIVHAQPTNAAGVFFPQYPQRQLGDRSRAAYKRGRSILSAIPPTAVRGSFTPGLDTPPESRFQPRGKVRYQIIQDHRPLSANSECRLGLNHP